MYTRYIVDWLTMSVQYAIRFSLKTIDIHSLIWLLFIDKQVTGITTDNDTLWVALIWFCVLHSSCF